MLEFLINRSNSQTLLNRKLLCVSEIFPKKRLVVNPQLHFLTIFFILSETIITQLISLISSSSSGWFHFSCLPIIIRQIFRVLKMLSNCGKLLMKQGLLNQGIRAISLSVVHSDGPWRDATFRGSVSQALLTSRPSTSSVTAG